MSVQTTASPRYAHTHHSHASRPATTPAARPPMHPGSVGQTMPPHLSPEKARTPGQTLQNPRSPSPNYFGLQVAEPYNSDSPKHAKHNWSPPSSSVRSTAAMSPFSVPMDQNPDFAAFRRQSEGKVFSLGTLHAYERDPFLQAGSANRTSKKLTESPKMTSESVFKQPLRPASKSMSLDPDAALLGRSPKRHLSSDSTSFPEPARKASPASFLPSHVQSPAADAPAHDFNPRKSLPNIQPPPSFALPKSRADTLPLSPQDPETSILITPQHLVNLIESASEQVLILDIRVSTQYAASRISGALNLCIPTTLLKRPSFNVQRLAETFKSNEQRTKFQQWRHSKYIVVYDAAASQMKDAGICLNTVKKFESEGHNGTLHIVKGGFAEFAKRFPNYIDRTSESAPKNRPTGLTLSSAAPDIPPVIGGCPMPVTKSAANPFFGNIRQNMDLIGGVGQIPVTKPASLSSAMSDQLPSWLKTASDEKDKGLAVSNKFLQIEKKEQKRMQEALSGNVTYETSAKDSAKTVQIAGLEKGSKNRYNNIWPFEHTRVKLQGVASHDCDYFNANHIKSPWSNKRYIATQGPIPATFTDFWNVIWQQEVRVVVMLTAEKEGGQVKAHDYWSGKRYGPFVLSQLSEKRASLEPAKINRHRNRGSSGGRGSTGAVPVLARLDSTPAGPGSNNEEPYVVVRKLTLSHEDHPFERMREITQLQYSGWPDFGAPAHPAHLLGLVEQCNAVVRTWTGSKHMDPDPPNPHPVLVHCSAGCGRTGTFCTVDSVIDMMKRQKSRRRARQGTPMDVDESNKSHESPFFSSVPARGHDDDRIDGGWLDRDDTDLIESTVDEFRHQRISMVQSLRQFVLCYETVFEWLAELDRSEREGV